MHIEQKLNLFKCLRDLNISYEKYAKAIGVRGKTAIHNAVVKGQFPAKGDFADAVIKHALTDERIRKWLGKHSPSWLLKPMPAPNIPPQTTAEEKQEEEVKPAMLTLTAMKHFNLPSNPFVGDVNNEKDIYVSQDHSFIREAMLDAGRRNGFIAVAGEVGSGKSVIRKAVILSLKADNISVVFPRIIDKTKITPMSLIDAIIMDISEDRPRGRLEIKTRQALKLLENRAKNGLRQVLIIEEAHLLTAESFKALKQIYELESDFDKLIGIILIGQSELLGLLDESKNSDIREVIRRISTARITGMGSETRKYLEFKFKRLGKKLSDIFSDDAIAAIEARLSTKVGRQTISTAYPLSVNNLVIRAMNDAAELGESLVTAEIVQGA